MLVLTRKREQRIVIDHKGKRIVITILKIQNGDKVSIGIEADSDTFIFREELLTRGVIGEEAKRLAGRAMDEECECHEDEAICCE